MEMTQTAQPTQATLTERMIFPVTPDVVAEIEDFWHERRLNSKSEAIRQLIEADLAQWREARRPCPPRRARSGPRGCAKSRYLPCTDRGRL